MSMRSTKDLKDIVSSQRAKSKLNGIAGSDYATNTNDKENALKEGNALNKKYSTNADVSKANDAGGDKSND